MLPPWTGACQASLSITSFRSLRKLMSIESVIPSNHLILCHPLLLPPSILPFIRVFSNESVLRHQVAKVLEFQFQHQSFKWIFKTEFLWNWLVTYPCNPKDSQKSSPSPQFKRINSSVLSFLYNPTLTSIHASAAAAKLLQSCLTLANPIDGSPPGSLVPGIFQAGTLEWVAISFSNAWKGKVKVRSLSHVWLLATPWTRAYQGPPSMGFSRQEYWSGLPLPSPIHTWLLGKP